MPRKTFNGSTNTTWRCPPNVYLVKAECWGIGGAGGNASVDFGGAGGGGSAYVEQVNIRVQPGKAYIINLSGTVWFKSSVTVLAANGQVGGSPPDGGPAASGGAGGLATNSIGLHTQSGSAGANGGAGGTPGAGGIGAPPYGGIADTAPGGGGSGDNPPNAAGFPGAAGRITLTWYPRPRRPLRGVPSSRNFGGFFPFISPQHIG